MQFMGGEYAQMWMIATPTKPGWCRCLWWFFAPAKTASKRTKTLARLPTWLDHQTRSAGVLQFLLILAFLLVHPACRLWCALGGHAWDWHCLRLDLWPNLQRQQDICLAGLGPKTLS